MINRIFNIDHIMLEKLVKEGVKIKLTTTNVADVEEYKHLKGVKPRGYWNTNITWDDVEGVGSNPVVARIGYSNSGSVTERGVILSPSLIENCLISFIKMIR